MPLRPLRGRSATRPDSLPWKPKKFESVRASQKPILSAGGCFDALRTVQESAPAQRRPSHPAPGLSRFLLPPQRQQVLNRQDDPGETGDHPARLRIGSTGRVRESERGEAAKRKIRYAALPCSRTKGWSRSTIFCCWRRGRWEAASNICCIRPLATAFLRRGFLALSKTSRVTPSISASCGSTSPRGGLSERSQKETLD